MTTPPVSIIIAAYNVESYLDDCLDSVIKQTYSHLEIILIDDGSTDQTPIICQHYAAQDSRIRFIRQKNAGLSAVRNLGVKKATSDYLVFVDGDDLLAPDYIHQLLHHLITHQSDISVCSYQIFTAKSSKSQSIPAEIISGHQATIKLLTKQNDYDVVAWNKLYKKSLFLDHHIAYPVGQIHEDNLTTYKLYFFAAKVAYLDQPLYLYRQRSGSIMNLSRATHRLKIKEQSALEAISFFSHPELISASKIALLLAKFAFIDASLSGKIDQKYYSSARKWLISHTQEYFKNPLLSLKLKIYLQLISHGQGFPYRIFRRLKH